MFHFSQLRILSLFSLLLIATTGCIFSPDDSGGDGKKPPTITYEWPSSKFILMDNFKKAYDAMDYDVYVAMLHPEYQFTYVERDQAGNATGVGVYIYDDEIVVADNMFSGNSGEDTDGNLVGGISDIQFDTLNPKDWTPIDPEHIYFGDFENAEGAIFEVEIIFHYEQDGKPATFTVKADQYFVVAPFPAQRDGISVVKWMIVGQQDEGTWAN